MFSSFRRDPEGSSTPRAAAEDSRHHRSRGPGLRALRPWLEVPVSRLGGVSGIGASAGPARALRRALARHLADGDLAQ